MTGITNYAIADIYEYIQTVTLTGNASLWKLFHLLTCSNNWVIQHPERDFVLKFSAMEIYNESVRDLLSADSTPLRLLDDPERGTIVEKSTEEILTDRNHATQLLSVCEAQRQIGETSLNEMSSRSHQIIRLTIESSSHESLGRENASTLEAAVLEKEIKDLILQRDIAQAQVKELLQMLGEDASSMGQVGLGNYPHLRVQISPDAEILEDETPISPDPQFFDVDIKAYSHGYSRSSSEDRFVKVPYFDENFLNNTVSPRILMSSSNSSETDPYHVWEEIEKQSNGVFEKKFTALRLKI
ncbi:UNVERIFIED_CONTAM: Kinesin-like protein KIN-7H [Sesamum radiatum]|uniref:Kinesin-like protein KIN-7H n=1 Tax=Sesamum radiatum TaxID=300843 RepID=A0AAW2V6F5_SESRA